MTFFVDCSLRFSCYLLFLFKIIRKSKKKNQIAVIRNAYVVQDDIEYVHTNVLPLWLFGFLY